MSVNKNNQVLWWVFFLLLLLLLPLVLVLLVVVLVVVVLLLLFLLLSQLISMQHGQFSLLSYYIVTVTGISQILYDRDKTEEEGSNIKYLGMVVFLIHLEAKYPPPPPPPPPPRETLWHNNFASLFKLR